MKRLCFLENLDYLLVALYALYLSYSATSTTTNYDIILLKLHRSSLCNFSKHKKKSLCYFLNKISIVQYLTQVICEKRMQNISLVLLLESYNLYPTYNNYLQKYKIVFRKYFSKNFVGNYRYYNDTYIDILALINLRLILICSNINGIYILWLYLMYFSFQKRN